MLKTLNLFCLKNPFGHGVAPQPHGNNFYRVYVRLKSTKERTLYEVLGVSRSASQKEIKSAFYRLSMKHHPDTNLHKEGAAESFRELTNAYQILSNIDSRKEYDAKCYPKSFEAARQSPGGSGTFYKSWARPPPPRGRTKQFDFDEFYRRHYGKTLKDADIQKQRIVLERKTEEITATTLKYFLFAYTGNVGREPPH